MNTNREKVIEVHDLVKRFGNFEANKRLTFDVYRGEIFGFLGANGAGKTTAMKILCGLSKPTSGSVMVAGINVNKHPEAVKKRIGYMSQAFSLYNDLTVKENFRFYGGVYGLSKKEIRDRTRYFLDKLEMRSFENMLLRNIPLGWKQKLAFSVASMHRPHIIFLDEPTGGVDPITRRQFWEMIYEASENGTTVFVTTHYMDEAEYCERVSIMSEGEIKALGRPRDLKQKYEVENMNDVFLRIARNVE
jgi:ABC-2 type transport system ATP-binding protein